METLRQVVEPISAGLELAGIAVVVVGAVVSTGLYLRDVWTDAHQAYVAFRKHLARAILLGLEFLVAGDIIATVVIDPTLTSVSVLGLIVLIRSFLSISLDMEVNGHWPWKRERPEDSDEPKRSV